MQLFLSLMFITFFNPEQHPNLQPCDSASIRLHIHQSEIALEKNLLSAKNHALHAVNLARQSSDQLLDEALIALGNVYWSLQIEDSTLLLYKEAIEILDHQEEQRRTALLRYNIATIYFHQGIYLTSIPNYEDALQYFQSTDDSLQIAEILLVLGDAYRLSGYNHKSMLHIHRALQAYQIWNDSTNIASCLSVLGTVHFQLNQPLKALEYYQQVYILQEQTQDIRGIVNTLILMSKVMPSENKSEEKLLEALTLCQKSNFHLLKAFVHDNLAKLYVDQKMFDRAIAHYEKSLVIRSSQSSRLRNNLAHTYTALGHVYVQKNMPDEAAKHLALAKEELGLPTFSDRLPEITQVISVEVYLQWLTVMGDYWQSVAKNDGDLEKALKYYTTAIDFILQEYIPNTYLNDTKLVQLKSHYILFEKALNLIHLLFQDGKDLYYLEQAYVFFRLSKAMLLQHAQLEETAMAQLRLNNDPLLLEEEALKNQLLAIEQLHRKALLKKNSDSLRIYQSKRAEAREKYYQWVLKIGQQYPSYANFKAQLQPPPLHDIQQRLKGNQLLLAYHEGSQDLYTLVIQQDTVIFLKQTLPKNWDQRFDTFRNALTNPVDLNGDFIKNKECIINEGQYFFSFLIETIPVDLYKACEQLLVVPDGVLQYLPFDALLTKQPAQDRYTAFPFLIREKTVHYGFSIPSFFPDPSHSQGQQLSTSHEFGGFAVDYAKAKKQSMLPNTQREVETIAKIMDGKAWTHTTKNIFSTWAPTCPVVHYAGHAEVQYENYADHRIIFEEQSNENDNYLYPAEIHQMNFSQTKLMVLSGCHTGDGSLYQGEGIMSLAHAFAMGGCSSLVMSLHAIDDQNSPQVFIPFYEQLKAGLSVSQALRQGKLQYLESLQNDPLRSHPYYWAGLVSIGQDVVLHQSTPMLPEVLKVILTIAFVVVLLVVAQKNTQRK